MKSIIQWILAFLVFLLLIFAGYAIGALAVTMLIPSIFGVIFTFQQAFALLLLTSVLGIFLKLFN